MATEAARTGAGFKLLLGLGLTCLVGAGLAGVLLPERATEPPAQTPALSGSPAISAPREAPPSAIPSVCASALSSDGPELDPGESQRLGERVGELKAMVAAGDHAGLLASLERAARAGEGLGGRRERDLLRGALVAVAEREEGAREALIGRALEPQAPIRERLELISVFGSCAHLSKCRAALERLKLDPDASLRRAAQDALAAPN